jgi:hypothetical protein
MPIEILKKVWLEKEKTIKGPAMLTGFYNLKNNRLP